MGSQTVIKALKSTYPKHSKIFVATLVCETVLKIILWPHLGRVVRRSLDYILFVSGGTITARSHNEIVNANFMNRFKHFSYMLSDIDHFINL